MKHQGTPITNRIAFETSYDEEGVGEICSSDDVRKMERVVNEMLLYVTRELAEQWKNLFDD